jgi:hypothetical protein
MFGLFRPHQPLSTWEKAWAETRFAYLVELVGISRLHSATVLLPTDEFFPEAFSEPPFNPHVLLDVVRAHLQLDVGDVSVQIVSDRSPGTTFVSSEHWDEPAVRVRDSLTHDAEHLISALVCELARIYLARGGYYSADAPDGPWAAELLTTVIGAGVFVANSAIREENISTGSWSSWTMERRGVLPARILGYGMALFAWARDEPPAWSRYLRRDAAAVVNGALRYLTQTRDSLFRPGEPYAPFSNFTIEQLLEELRHGTPSERMAALWELSAKRDAREKIEPALRECLRDRDADLRAEAARTFVQLDSASPATEKALFLALRDKSDHVRIAAADAIAALGSENPDTLDELALMLEDSNLAVIGSASRALARFGPRARQRTDLVLAALRRGLIACQDPIIAAAIEALCAIEPDPAFCLCEAFGEDAEFLDRAVRALRAYGPDAQRGID